MCLQVSTSGIRISIKALNIHLLFFSVFILGSCKKDAKINLAPDAKTIYDVKYGNNIKNTLDVYLPKNRNASTPVVFIIHGGSWSSGDKADMNFLVHFFLEKNMAVVNINYRYKDSLNKYYEIQQDVFNAIEFVVSHSSDYSISNDKYCLLGFSAGGQLAMQQGYANNSNKRIKAIVSIAGPSNFTNPFYQACMITTDVEDYLGCTFNENPFIWQLNSPYFHTSKYSPKTYIIHGTNDNFVDTQDSENLHLKLDSLNVPNELELFNKDHLSLLYLPDSSYLKIAEWVNYAVY